MKKNSFMEGAIIATIAIIISKIIGILYVIPFYRIIGEKGGALYGYAYNIYNVFLIISSAGIPLAISKITSEYETKKEYDKKNAMFSIAKKAIYFFSIFSFLICFIFAKPLATLILGELSGGNTIADVTFVIRCVSFALLVVPILSVSRGYLQGHKYISASSFSQVIEQIVRIAVILLGSYIAIKILHIPLTYAVGISVFSAAIGAIAGYIYLKFKMRKVEDKNNNSLDKITKADKKEIINKLIGYSVPFIIINVASSLYNTTDMILLIRGLNMLGYNAADIEVISSTFTTWGSKLTGIVTSFASGLVISLIPSLVASYTAKKQDEVNSYFNKSLQVLLFIILPITVFMSIFSYEIWTIFYGDNYYGPIIFQYIIIVAFLDSAYLMINSALQGLYKTKLIYIGVFSGLLTNIILDLPLIFLFHKLGLYPYYGAITATVISYLISLGIPLITLAKKDNFNYKSTMKMLPRLIVSIGVILVMGLALKNLIPSFDSRLLNIVYLGVMGIIIMGTYYAMNFRVINTILEQKLAKLFKK
ncbi:MAG: polysaccharide biosynthesis protein [Bacilli bacterium]|nr:polysaccharide biosynthesis protein [Bacilli bacterium]